jgi:hypothetical protein
LLTLAELKPKVAIGRVRPQQKLIQVVLSVLIPTETNRDISQATSRVVIARFLLQQFTKSCLRFVKATLIDEKLAEPRHGLGIVRRKKPVLAQKSDRVLSIAVALVSVRLAQKGTRLTLDLKCMKSVDGGAAEHDTNRQNDEQPEVQSIHFAKNSPIRVKRFWSRQNLMLPLCLRFSTGKRGRPPIRQIVGRTSQGSIVRLRDDLPKAHKIKLPMNIVKVSLVTSEGHPTARCYVSDYP